MFVCPACQTENRPTAKFCRKCGLRRQTTEGSTVAVAEPAERPSDPQPATSPVGAGFNPARQSKVSDAVKKDGDQSPAPAPVANDSSIPATSTFELAESEEDFGEEITEEEVQKELEQRSAGAPAQQQSEVLTDENAVPESAREQPQTQAQPVEPKRGGHTCPTCGSNVRLTDKFCIWCGERQPQRVVPKMKRCSECRTQLPMTANFCFVCGNDVSLHLRRKVRVPSELFHEEDPELFPTYEA